MPASDSATHKFISIVVFVYATGFGNNSFHCFPYCTKEISTTAVIKT